MTNNAAIDVSQEANCAADEADRIVAEKKYASCPDVIAAWLTKNAPDRAGTETGPLAVWRWNELHDKGLPIVCMDARHGNAVPEASFFGLKTRLECQFDPIDLRLPGIHISAGVRTTLL